MAGPVRNWFAEPWVAPRYAAGRPDVHGPVAQRIRARVAPAARLGRAADVGCGTGLAARALSHFVDRIVGLDPSAPMLAQASRAGGLDFVRARGERLPLGKGSVDLVTIAGAWHWCDQPFFLAEVARVLRPGGWLVVYDSDFRGDPDQPGLLAWLREEYWGSLLRIGRNAYFDPATHDHVRLRVVESEEVEVVARMTRDEVCTLITSQASTAGNVEQGHLTLAEAESRLAAGLAPFWSDAHERRPIRFVSPLHFLERET